MEKNQTASQKQKTVLVFGTFDGIHPGHIHFLSEAKKLGRLAVSVSSDKSAKFRGKSPAKDWTKRITDVKKLGIADEVVKGDTKIGNWGAIKKFHPDIVAVGYDQKGLADALKTIQKEYGFKIRTIKSHEPEKFHSSILKKTCAYCTIPAIKERAIAENRLAWAFPTNIPIVPGHVLVAPKRCVASFEEMTKSEWLAIFDLATRLKRSLKKSFGAEGFNVAWNEGVLAGQSIPHFHLHILPRKTGDTGITKYEPRKFLYRPGSREKTSEKELQAVAKLIKKNL